METAIALESPDFLRMSLAAAMTLGFEGGKFHRSAKLTCLNLLLTYRDGCRASCAYCGLSRARTGDEGHKSFIRVKWPTYSLDQVLDGIEEKRRLLHRICISMVTHPRSFEDSLYLVRRIGERSELPISVLLSPTVMRLENLSALKGAGAERVGIALDAANQQLFEMLRGRGVDGPHRWDRYWEFFQRAVGVFGRGMAGIHLIVGLGEQEMEMARLFQEIRDEGGRTHLFSFYPEGGSALEGRPQAPAPSFRRLQMARWLIDEGVVRYEKFSGDILGRIMSFGLDTRELEKHIRRGVPFITSGCPDAKGNVACNRPYGDSPPGDDIRSFPFKPDRGDLEKIRLELSAY